MKLFAYVSLSLALLGACHEKQELTAPPPPLRPAAEPVAETKGQAKDCDPVDPDDELKPIGFDNRSITESLKLSDQARAELKTAESAEVERLTREQYITDSVEHLITSLRADPYNVNATYSLAAAYARIGRRQCSINMLTRLLQMRPHWSKHDDVENALNHLLGRNNQQLDADFSELRSDERFRTLIAKMCDGTNDSNCVYGSQSKKP